MSRSPASIALETLRTKVVAIGNNPYVQEDFLDALRLLRHEAPQIRRAAASAVGKLLDGSSALAEMAYIQLHQAVVDETHPQVRQYQLAALRRCARRLTKPMIDDIEDIARNPNEKDYVRTAANDVVALAQAAQAEAESLRRHWCSRCKRPISAEESATAIRRYGKPYCRHCLDERTLDDRNFERDVEEAKRLRTKDGTAVQSQGERRIADWLAAHGIDYAYDERYRIAGDVAIRPDFYLPAFDLYIEYWGMGHRDYLARKAEKRILYQRAGKRLLSLDFNDLPVLEARLEEKLRLYLHP